MILNKAKNIISSKTDVDIVSISTTSILYTMSSIVTSILSSTLGLFWNKTRDATAKSLKDGDVTDAKIREIVVRELNDIKFKLDGLSRKDLESSYMFLKEGVQLLIVSLDKSKDEQNAVVNEDKDDGCVSSSTMPSGGDILNDALQLSQAMGKLNIVCNQSATAKKRFERSREKATDAFCNKALSIEDRIFAAKIRVLSEILECLDNPDTAVTSCLLFLEQLHDLPAVREIFSVYLGGGVKSILGKAERAENVKSIMMINYVLHQFVRKFSSKYYGEFNWPVIQLNDRTQFNPILSWREVSMRPSWGYELEQPPNIVKVDQEINPKQSAVNSRGEIIVVHNDGVRIISKTGKTKSVLPLPVLLEVEDDIIKGVAVDEENDVYLTVRDNFYKGSAEVWLYVFDEDCNDVKHRSKLNFLLQKGLHFSLVVNKNKDIVMKEDDVYVCDVTGQLKYKFKPKFQPTLINVSTNNEIIIVSGAGYNTVEIYTEEGNLKTTITLPAGHEVRGAAFHFGISKIIVLSVNWRKDCLRYLHCYSEKGEQHTSACRGMKAFFQESFRFLEIKSHPSGPAVVLTPDAILYL